MSDQIISQPADAAGLFPLAVTDVGSPDSDQSHWQSHQMVLHQRVTVGLKGPASASRH